MTSFTDAVAALLKISSAQVDIVFLRNLPSARAHVALQDNSSRLIKTEWELSYFLDAAPSATLLAALLNVSFPAPLLLNVTNVSVVTTEGPSVAIQNAPGPLRVNPDQYVFLESTLRSPLAQTAIWSVSSSEKRAISITDVLLTKSIMMNFTAADMSQNIAFPLGFAASSPMFLPGIIYTFQLMVLDSRGVREVVYDTIHVVVNHPLVAGTVSVSPSHGFALSTSFRIYASGWVDSRGGGQLLYQFFFQTAQLASPLALSGLTSNSDLVTVLPAGSKYFNYNASIIVVVQSSTGVTSNVSYTINIAPSFSVGNLTSLEDSVESGNGTINSLNNVVLSINANQDTLLQDNGGICGAGSDCLSGYCIGNTCSSSVQHDLCFSSSHQYPCSGHGTCSYYDAMGDISALCLLKDTSCVAYCQCNAGYGGKGCQESRQDYILQDEVRGRACSALLNISQTTNLSVSDALSTFSEIYQPPNIFSNASMATCISVLQTLLQNLTLEANAQDISTAKTVASIIASIGESFFFSNLTGNSTLSQNIIGPLLNTFSSALLKTMVVGQIYNFTSANLKLTVLFDYLSNLDNGFIAPSQSSLSYVNFSSSGLSSCYASGSYASIAITEWSLSPYSTPLAIRSNLLGLSLANTSASIASKGGSSSVFYLTLAYVSPQNLSEVVPIKNYGNLSYPAQCVVHDGSSFESCNCNLSSYNDLSAVFACDVQKSLCPKGSGGGRYFQNNAPTLSPTRVPSIESEITEGSLFNIREYSVLITGVLDDVTSVLENRISFDSFASKVVLAVVLILIVILFGGLVYFSRWDAYDRRKRIYVPKEKDVRSVSYYELQAYRKSVDNAFQAGSVLPSAFNDQVILLFYFSAIDLLTFFQ